MGKDTLEKCYSTLRQVAMNCSYCIAILLTKDTLVGSLVGSLLRQMHLMPLT